MVKNQLFLISFLGAIAIVIGALGAHKFEAMVDEKHLGYLETGVFYHLIHVLGLLFLFVLDQMFDSFNIKRIFQLFVIGIFLFSGSLYLLTFNELVNFGMFKYAIIAATPIGGTCFVIGWVLLGVKSKSITKN